MIDYHHKKADKILHHTYPSLHNQSILKALNLQFKTELSCNWTTVTGELRSLVRSIILFGRITMGRDGHVMDIRTPNSGV